MRLFFPALALALVAPSFASPRAAEDHAKEWPEAKDEAALEMAVKQVVDETSDEMEELGRETIEKEGAAAAPLLLRSLAKAKDDDEIERTTGALDLVTAKTHTRLLAEDIADDSAPLRRYALRRVAELGDSGLQDRALEIVEEFAKRAESKRKKKRVEDTDLDLAAILAMSTGSAEGLDRVVSIAGSKSWGDWSVTLCAAAANAKSAGTDVADALGALLVPGVKSSARVGTLRLLGYAGTPEHARFVASSLDANANHVKIAAINALRVMVDGDEPLKKLSAFDAIERAKAWKKRI